METDQGIRGRGNVPRTAVVHLGLALAGRRSGGPPIAAEVKDRATGRAAAPSHVDRVGQRAAATARTTAVLHSRIQNDRSLGDLDPEVSRRGAA